ncbi:MAG: oxygenase MpaB family protein [Pedobacter sp.]|nr:oxygenase MpaB family protein [Pedobacter sp.]
MSLPAYDTRQILGPDSLMWRYFGDARHLLFLGGGSVVQVAHPVVGKGVADHSVFKTDPYGRLRRSIDLLWPVVYNTPAGVLEYGRKLREQHRAIKGTGYDGKAYFALNPEPYLWVHISAYVLFVALGEFIEGRPLSEAEKEQLYREWLQLGRQMGVRDQDMPADIPAYKAYVDMMVAERTEHNETLDYVMNRAYFVERPLPPGSKIPQALWVQLRKPMGHISWICGRAGMPESFREKFGLELTRSEKLQFKFFSQLLRLLWPLVPENKRWFYPAWQAIREARRHPEKFQAQDVLPKATAA